MYERFTDRARKVMQLANQEAQRFNHEYIGTEHILLGLVKEGSGVASNVLKNLNIDLNAVRREVEKILGQPGSSTVLSGRLPHTPRSKKVIDYAIEEARGLKDNYVGTEHLLLGLMLTKDGVAAQVLMNLGLKIENVRREVLNLLGHAEDKPHAIPKPLLPHKSDTYSVSDLPPAGISDRPERLTDQQLQIVQERIDQLAEPKEAEALKRLLAWYKWYHRHS
jgi:ATP-dependent Clp protease ATP-binding subunit ClpA